LDEWQAKLDWDRVEQFFLDGVVSTGHLQRAIKWLRSNISPDHYLSIPAYESLLDKVNQSSSRRVKNQARDLVYTELLAIRRAKGKRKQHTEVSRREAELLRLEIMLDLDSPPSRVVQFASVVPRDTSKSIVVATVETYLRNLASQGRNEDIANLAVELVPKLPFLLRSTIMLQDQKRVADLVYSAILNMGDIGVWLQRRSASMPSVKVEMQGLVLRQDRWARMLCLRALIGRENSHSAALDVFQRMVVMNDQLDTDLTSSLYSWLARSDMLQEAIAVYDALRKSGPLSPIALRRALRVMARAGRSEDFESLTAELHGRGLELDDDDRLSQLQGLVQAGQLEEAENLADLYFPATPSPTVKCKSTRRRALDMVLSGRAREGDVDGSLRLLTAILGANEVPSLVEFNAFLNLFARRGDAESANQVVEQMKAAGVELDRTSYSTLMALHAHRRDAIRAQAVWEEMRMAGFPPDAVAISTLINAYIEAGNWVAAADIWRNIDDGLRCNHSVVGVMLKGLVLLSAPFEDVFRVFRDSYPDSASADAQAWALTIQSACDSGRMDIALDLYNEMATLADLPDSRLQLTAHVYSILMAGYVRAKDVASVQAVLSEMRERHIAPTSVTEGIIIKAMADGIWPGSSITSEEYAERLIKSGDVMLVDQAIRSRGSAVENVLGPLITINAKKMDSAAAEHYFKKIVAEGVQPTLHMYTTLLDAFRRCGDLEGLERTWKAVLQHATAVAYTAPGPSGLQVVASQRNMLCIPLSIYMDGLTAACQHTEVARVWRDVAQLGFSFDAHNWNHFAVALVRAGEVEKAFQIAEEVLIPRHEEVQHRKIATQRPLEHTSWEDDVAESTPLDGSAKPSLEGDFQADPAQRPPNRRHQYRRGGRDELARQLYLERQEADLSTAEREGHHIRLNLDIFDQWRPSDITWRPTYLTIAVLDRAYSKLQQGRSVLALSGDEEDRDELDFPLEAGTDGTQAEASEHHIEQSASQKSSPHVLFARINSKYTKTVGLIMLHRRKKRDHRIRNVRRREGGIGTNSS
jgi:pentatricopeptide repeat protein